jgi:hypothetical protein
MSKFECRICGENIEGATIHDFMMDDPKKRVDWQVCPNHFAAVAFHQLDPQAVQKLRHLHGGDTYHTHDDFYDEEGQTVQ